MKHVLLLSLLLTLAACASSPLQLDGVNRGINPAMVTRETPHAGQRVVWGGMIIQTRPLQTTTQLEILAYPLQGNGEPDRQASSLGRFLIIQHGFLDPANYKPGRWVSVVGQIGHIQTGKVGKASYQFPVIQSEQLHLWPLHGTPSGSTHFNFGIGIRL